MAFYVLLAYSKIKYVQNLYAMNPYQKTQTAILLIGMHRQTQHSPAGLSPPSCFCNSEATPKLFVPTV